MRHPTAGFYLRRASDPTAKGGRENWPGVKYSCEASCPALSTDLFDDSPLTGKDCPGVDASSCVNDNVPFLHFADAWEECGRIAECGFIMRHPNRGFYLRRATDPTAKGGRESWPGVNYGCMGASSSCPGKKFVPFEDLSPEQGRDCWGDASSCLNGNKPFQNFADAWKACGRVPECGFIMRHPTAGFYLRRASDPTAKGGRENWPGVKFSC